MLEFIREFIIFMISLFIYLHVYFHLKTSNELSNYELDNTSKNKLEEILDSRQPVIFKNSITDHLIKELNIDYIHKQFSGFDVKIRDLTDCNSQSELYIPLPFKQTIDLLKKDSEQKYISECNDDFLSETGLNKKISYHDDILRPSFVCYRKYDIMMASTNTSTPLRYNISYRNFFMITQGSAKVLLTPPKNYKYIFPTYDYENFEFRSPINPWNPQDIYKNDFDKIKCLELTLVPGKILFIPAYWWYSFKFGENTSIVNCEYQTYMNKLATLPYSFMYILQNQNIERKLCKETIQSDDSY